MILRAQMGWKEKWIVDEWQEESGGKGGQPRVKSFLGRKWLIGKKIKKELDKPEGLSHAKMV